MTQETFFFIGIGGIGMSALARYFLLSGHRVGGYDRVRTPITTALEELGGEIIYEDDPEKMADAFRENPEVRVVFTPAIHEDNRLRQYFKAKGIPERKRSEVLGEISRMHKALCVAGTHGKTTTSTLLAHLLKSSHIGTNAFLGGLSLNFGSNLLVDDKSPYVVVEADEYDRSFHRLSPFCSIITSNRPDHLDIYGTEEAFHEAFRLFAGLTSKEGRLLLQEEVRDLPAPEGVLVETYGASEVCDYYYSRLRYEGGELFFDWHYDGGKGVFRDLQIGTPIEINVLNATAALALAYRLGCTEEELREGLKTFRGAHRRFERTKLPGGRVVIDDYAHHPDEIRASLASIRDLYPEREITVVFQPHLFTRTRDFLEDFGRALSIADEVILIPIYPAREEPIPGVTSEAILPFVTSARKSVATKETLPAVLRGKKPEVLVMMGAGDIEFEVPKAIESLKD